MRIRVDVHAHLVPIEPRLIASIDGVNWEVEGSCLVVDGHRVGIKELFQPEALVAWMDQNEVAHALISVPPPAYREQLDDQQTEVWCRYLNEGLLRISERSEARLSALVHLPIHAPTVAERIVELELAQGRNLFSAPTGAPSVKIASPEFDPLWKMLSDSGSFIFLHPGSCADSRLSSFYMSNLVGNPHETGVAVASLVLGGVTTRFPGITFCLAHAGGSTPMLAGRIQRGYDTARPGLSDNAPSVSQSLSSFTVDCITHSEEALVLAEQTFGKENLVFGSDWPFPMGLIDPARQLESWDPERLERICNCVSLRSRLVDRSQKPISRSDWRQS